MRESDYAISEVAPNVSSVGAGLSLHQYRGQSVKFLICSVNQCCDLFVLESNDCSAELKAFTGSTELSTISKLYNFIHNQTFAMHSLNNNNFLHDVEDPPSSATLTAEKRELSREKVAELKCYRIASDKMLTHLQGLADGSAPLSNGDMLHYLRVNFGFLCGKEWVKHFVFVYKFYQYWSDLNPNTSDVSATVHPESRKAYVKELELVEVLNEQVDDTLLHLFQRYGEEQR